MGFSWLQWVTKWTGILRNGYTGKPWPIIHFSKPFEIGRQVQQSGAIGLCNPVEDYTLPLSLTGIFRAPKALSKIRLIIIIMQYWNVIVLKKVIYHKREFHYDNEWKKFRSRLGSYWYLQHFSRIGKFPLDFPDRLLIYE